MDYAYLVVLFVLVMLDIALIGFKVPLLGFLFSVVSLSVTAASLSQSANIPYYPYPNVLLALTAVILMFSSALTFRRDR